MKKLPDDIACERLIKRTRENAKKSQITKTISLRLDGRIEGLLITALMVVHFRKTTGNVSLSHGLSSHNHIIFPRINQKRSCKNRSGIQFLKTSRRLIKKAASRYKAYYTTEKMFDEEGYSILTFLSIHVNPESMSMSIGNAIEAVSWKPFIRSSRITV